MYILKTDYNIASTSPDHLYPRGVMNMKGGPNYTWKNGENLFADEVIKYFNKKELRVLDLGAASGYLVNDFLIRGVDAVGIEGSTWAIENKVPIWEEYHNTRLFTGDIGKDFQILFDGTPVTFDLINAWEVVEHLPPEELKVFAKNVYNHLSNDGIFVCSISPWYEPAINDPNINLHLSHEIKSKHQWVDIFSDFQFIGPVSEKYDCAFHYIFKERYRGRVRGPEGQKHTFWSTMKKRL